MAYLELAEGYLNEQPGFVRYMAETPEDLYVFVPTTPDGSEGMYVREDYFDNLPPGEWERVMNELADYQPAHMNGIFSRIRENIAARRERRDERKTARQDSQMKRIEGRSGGLFGGKLKGFIGSLIPGGDQAGMNMPTSAPGGMMPTRDPWNIDFQAGQQSWFDQNKAWVIPAGIGAAALTVYLVTKKKK